MFGIGVGGWRKHRRSVWKGEGLVLERGQEEKTGDAEEKIKSERGAVGMSRQGIVQYSRISFR